MSSRDPSATATPRTFRWLGPAIALVVAGALALAALGGSDGSENAAPPSEPVAGSSAPQADAGAVSADMARRQPGDPLAMGAVDAPVVMVEWADFQCPFCGRFARETAPELIERYVDAGVLRIEWRDFPYLGPESTLAARAGRAAAQQDTFWAFHDGLYAEPRDVNSGALTSQAFIQMADELGLDVDAFAAALEDPDLAAQVQADLAAGQRLGVTGTPAFLINGQPVLGAQPLEVFVQLIEAAAADAR